MRRKESDRKRQAGEQAEAQGRKKRKKQWWEEEQEGQEASDDDDRAYYKEQVIKKCNNTGCVLMHSNGWLSLQVDAGQQLMCKTRFETATLPTGQFRILKTSWSEEARLAPCIPQMGLRLHYYSQYYC